MLKRSNLIFGMALSLGMAWCFAGDATAASADKNASGKNAISMDSKENCDKAKADCPKSAADCPKGAECPKDKHCPKGSQCHKHGVNGAKHGEAKSKEIPAAGSTVAPAEKPAEAAKEAAPAH